MSANQSTGSQQSNGAVKAILIVVIALVVVCVVIPCIVIAILTLTGPQIANIFSKVTSGLSAP